MAANIARGELSDRLQKARSEVAHREDAEEAAVRRWREAHSSGLLGRELEVLKADIGKCAGASKTARQEAETVEGDLRKIEIEIAVADAIAKSLGRRP